MKKGTNGNKVTEYIHLLTNIYCSQRTMFNEGVTKNNPLES